MESLYNVYKVLLAWYFKLICKFETMRWFCRAVFYTDRSAYADHKIPSELYDVFHFTNVADFNADKSVILFTYGL